MKDNKKIGSDLDGVIAKNYLNKADYRPYRLHEYYSKAIPSGIHKVVSPVAIITGRRVHYQKATIKWLAYEGINYNTLIMFPNKEKKSNKTLAEFKAKYINKLGLITYFEDDEDIAKQLKELCPCTHIYQIGEINIYENENGFESVMIATRERINVNGEEYDQDSIYI